ncbi:hypothetical protein [Sulfurimonas sp. C5]|uniref:hypothetical protein n=1 Tax=Sulfurimonas sp. C5 TaxID=3036947 RepID=UPI0024582C60|nr:hypothetical protein [Sulfurimonas sp. C5]MDH4944412.1 hypothetical protein [Sulfurimonas sp. C5]
MDLDQFLKLFNPLPGNCYMQVTTNPDDTTTALGELMQKVNGELRVVYYTEDQDSFGALNVEKKQQVDNFLKPFRALPRDNDVVIFQEILSQHTKPEQLVKIAYTTLANAAHIIIMEKKGNMDIEATIDMLDRFEFRSPNYIDNVVEGYDLVMAKKLHMWGNGL